MASLDRTFAFAEDVNVAMFVAEDLELDVPWSVDVPLEVERVVAEGDARLGACRLEDRAQFFLGLQDSAFLTASSISSTSSVPSIVGSPRDLASARALTLSPHWRIWSGSGPMNSSPHWAQVSANSGFSDKNP
jgi:hypothetical protein